jgi:uncharacterized membrane protein YqjE
VGAAILLLLGLTLAIVFAADADNRVVTALVVAAVFLVVGGGATWLGLRHLPKNALSQTRARLQGLAATRLPA